MYRDRIRLNSLWGRVIAAEEAALMFRDGMIVGMSGFTRAGDCKEVPFALAERARLDPLKITLMTGASLGNDIDHTLAEADVIGRRLPFQSDPTLRRKINAGEVMFIDQHLSETVEMLRSRQIGPIDIAVVEASAITEAGGLVPTTSVGNTATFAVLAERVIVEINLTMPHELEGMHDIYFPTYRPYREAIPITSVDSRVGLPAIPLDPQKIAGIVITRKADSPSRLEQPDAETQTIAGHLEAFLANEVRRGRMRPSLQPLQIGVGSIANAVMHGFLNSRFSNLTMYSEVLQDSAFDLLDSGKMTFASGCSFTLSPEHYTRVLADLPRYRDRMVLRPQEISNHPEVVRRLGIIAINTALECDIYGNVNSTHVGGTHMMNGIGGSGDFARNAYFSVFVTKSVAKGGAISSIVPMVSHVDHTEHDVDILVTEIGLADLRGLAPRERAELIIRNCAHPRYRDALMEYFRAACRRGGHTPHVLEDALSWHVRARENGSMAGA
jgi:succinyl-CoA:acetate CoA-transferase